MADKTRPAPPELVMPMPPCPLCGIGTEHDEDFFCPHCRASWPNAGHEGNWMDTGDQCPSTRDDDRCVLTEGHGREHRDSHGDGWPGEPYRIWGGRGAGGYVSEARDEASARYVARICGYEVVSRMSDQRDWLVVPVSTGDGDL